MEKDSFFYVMLGFTSKVAVLELERYGFCHFVTFEA
jgi:hypothetical protein